MTERIDARAEEWPLRPWLMATLAAAAGLIFHILTDHEYSQPLPVGRQVAATFVAIATLSIVITVERYRWLWSVLFALSWGAVTALVGWFTAGYNLDGSIFEFPYLAALFAVMIAAPLFQTGRDEGAWTFPYQELHGHAWADAVIGAASLIFIGISFLLAHLIASLFDVIGINALKMLLRQDWFGWGLAGLAFGGAFGLLRERDRLVDTLLRLVTVVLSVLAPVLAVSLVAFLLSIPFTGLDKLWKGWLSATGLLLAASAGAFVLLNAVIGDGREENSNANRILRWSSLILAAVVAPLAALAGIAMSIRIGAYGWTPERIWGAVAVVVALAYGVAGWWAIWRGRFRFDDYLRPLQTRLAIALCTLAVVLALPIVDFGAISARSQLARLESGKTTPDKFDWAAMAFDFGQTGRKQLERISVRGPKEWHALARSAIRAEDRFQIVAATAAVAEVDEMVKRVRSLTPGLTLTPEILRAISRDAPCFEGMECLVFKDGAKLFVVSRDNQGLVDADLIDPKKPRGAIWVPVVPQPVKIENLDSATIEVRTVTRRQVFVDGKPVGGVVE